jgi:hypothetical protein
MPSGRLHPHLSSFFLFITETRCDLGTQSRFCAKLGSSTTPNSPEPETAEIELLVRHPVHGKCPAIRIPIFPLEDQRMLDWEVTGVLVTLIINRSTHLCHQGLGRVTDR